jgi:hypothetical protein
MMRDVIIDSNIFILFLAGQINENKIETETVVQNWFFDTLGITDSSILMMAKDCELLISGDSSLCDHAKSLNIKTFDFKEYLHSKL